MIQRIQTLLFLGAGILHSLLFALPIWSYRSGGSELVSTIGVNQNSPLMLFNIAIIAGLAVAIMLYKKRMLQLKVSRFMILAIAAFTAFMLISVEQSKEMLGVDQSAELTDYRLAAIIPIISLVLVLMAGRAIWKDEQLVRSADRLR